MKYRQVRIDVRAMGDAAMNVAASGGGGGAGGSGGGQRIVKEGWLQKRGTVNDIFIIFTFCTMFARRHVSYRRTLLSTLFRQRAYVTRGTTVTSALRFELSSSTRSQRCDIAAQTCRTHLHFPLAELSYRTGQR